jgi:L-lactate dehydrogenase complex protein LldF
MRATSLAFEASAKEALANPALQDALGKIKTGWQANRTRAAAALPEFEALRDRGQAIKNHTLQHLDLYLEAYEAKVTACGGHVHFAHVSTAAALDLIRGDSLDGGRQLTRHLIERGYDDIAFIGGDSEASSLRDRLAG